MKELLYHRLRQSACKRWEVAYYTSSSESYQVASIHYHQDRKIKVFQFRYTETADIDTLNKRILAETSIVVYVSVMSHMSVEVNHRNTSYLDCDTNIRIFQNARTFEQARHRTPTRTLTRRTVSDIEACAIASRYKPIVSLI